MQCGLSVQMPVTSVTPNTGDQTVRNEGNAAHWLARKWFENGGDGAQYIGETAFNGVIITVDMVSHVAQYLQSINCGEVETDVSFLIDDVQVNCRADHISFDGTTLDVDDFKYGWRIIEPRDNWTMISYAIGYCLLHNVQPSQIRLRIHQPRPHHFDGPLREWVLTYAELMTLYTKLGEHLRDPNPVLRTGPSCYKCPAFTGCPAATIAQSYALEAVFETAFVDDIDDAALSQQLDILTQAETIVKNRLNAAQELAKHRCTNGAIVPNYGVERSYGNRAFVKIVTPEFLQGLTGKKCHVEKVMTPKQCENLGVDPAVIAAFTERPFTGLKLTRVDADKKAQRIFGKVNK
jgi:hypothetical protein